MRLLNTIYTKKKTESEPRLNQNLEESESHSDSEHDYDGFQNNNMTEDVIRDEEEDQIQDSKPTSSRKKTWNRH